MLRSKSERDFYLKEPKHPCTIFSYIFCKNTLALGQTRFLKSAVDFNSQAFGYYFQSKFTCSVLHFGLRERSPYFIKPPNNLDFIMLTRFIEEYLSNSIHFKIFSATRYAHINLDFVALSGSQELTRRSGEKLKILIIDSSKYSSKEYQKEQTFSLQSTK